MEEYTKEKLKEFMKKKAPVNFKMFINIVIAIIVLAYFILINIVNQNTYDTNGVIKTFTMIFLISTIVIFEIAYKKDDEILAINGIETLILSIHTLLINHILSKFNFDFQTYTLVSSLLITAYYILKTLIMFTRERKKYLDSLSDISEIVKKEQPIKKEAKKRNVKVEEEPKKKTKKSNKEIKKVIVESKLESKYIEKEEKIKAPRKKTIEKKDNTSNSSKRRGRPKKEVV